MLIKHLLLLIYSFILSGFSYIYFVNCYSLNETFCGLYGSFGSAFLNTLYFYLFEVSKYFLEAEMLGVLLGLLLFYYLLGVIFSYSADFIHYVRTVSFSYTTEKRPINYYVGIFTYTLSFALLSLFTILFTKGYVDFGAGLVY